MLPSRLGEADRLRIVPALGREIRPGKDLRALFQLVRLFRRIRPQIVHTHSSKAGHPGPAGRRAGRGARGHPFGARFFLFSAPALFQE